MKITIALVVVVVLVGICQAALLPKQRARQRARLGKHLNERRFNQMHGKQQAPDRVGSTCAESCSTDDDDSRVCVFGITFDNACEAKCNGFELESYTKGGCTVHRTRRGDWDDYVGFAAQLLAYFEANPDLLAPVSEENDQSIISE